MYTTLPSLLSVGEENTAPPVAKLQILLPGPVGGGDGGGDGGGGGGDGDGGGLHTAWHVLALNPFPLESEVHVLSIHLNVGGGGGVGGASHPAWHALKLTPLLAGWQCPPSQA